MMNYLFGKCLFFIFFSQVGEYKAAEVKKALDMLYLAGILIPATHTSGNGLPVGLELLHYASPNMKHEQYFGTFTYMDPNPDSHDTDGMRNVDIYPLYAISKILEN